MSLPSRPSSVRPVDAEERKGNNPLTADGYGWLIAFIVFVMLSAIVLALMDDLPADAEPVSAPEAFVLLERTVMKDRHGAGTGWLEKGTILVPTGLSAHGLYEAVGPDGRRVWLDDGAQVGHDARTFDVTRDLAIRSERGTDAESVLRAFRSAFERSLSPSARIDGASAVRRGQELVWHAPSGHVVCIIDGRRPYLSSVTAREASFPLPLSLRVGMDMESAATALGNPMWDSFTPAPPDAAGWKVASGSSELLLSFSADSILTGVSYRNGGAVLQAPASNDVFGSGGAQLRLGDGEGKIERKRAAPAKGKTAGRTGKKKRR